MAVVALAPSPLAAALSWLGQCLPQQHLRAVVEEVLARLSGLRAIPERQHAAWRRRE
jgi:hypothetical protein